MLGKDQREDGSYRLFLPPLFSFKIKKKKQNKKEKDAKYLLTALVLNHSFTRQTT